MIAWKVGARAGGRLLGRPAALAARSALLGRRRSCVWPRRPACPPGCSTWCRAARRRRSGSLAPGRRHGVVHRVQRRGRGRDEGGRADAHEGRARARRQVADRGAARRRPRRARWGPRCCGSVATPVRAAERRRGSWSIADDDELRDAAVAFLRERVPVGDPHRRADRGRSADHAPSTATAWRATSRRAVGRRRPRRDRRRPPRRAGRGSSWSRPWSPRSHARRRDLPGRAVRPGRRRCMRLRHRRRSGAIANNSRYGLNALVWGDPERGAGGRAPAGDRHRRDQRRRRRAAGRPVGRRQAVRCRQEMGEDGFAEFFTVRHLQWPDGVTPRPLVPQPRPRRRLAGRTVGRARRRAGRSSRGCRSSVTR